jgi:hypothetical protein
MINLTYHETKVGSFTFLPGQYKGDTGLRTINGLQPLVARRVIAELEAKGFRVAVEAV